jgi:hypothetical protein
MEYISYIIIAGVAFYLGWKFNEKIMFITFGKMMQEAGVTNAELNKFINHYRPEMIEEGLIDEDDGLERIEIKLEQHGSAIFAYRKDNDQFLGQGTDKETLVQRLTETMRNVRLIISQDDGADLIKEADCKNS